MIKIEDYSFLLKVLKPTRYSGGEINEVVKENRENFFNVAICFPDVYDVGMSNLGLQILYSVLNKKEGIWAQRCFMPFLDMEEELLKRGIALYGLESGMGLNKFDLIGFSLQYELVFSNVLRMLHLGKIPLYSKERNNNFPLVIAGGPSAVNPEPLSDFIDAFFVGDGEEGFVEICEVLVKEKKSDKNRKLERLARVEGVFVPEFYERKQSKKRFVIDFPKNPDAPRKIKKRILKDLEIFPMPESVVIPSHETIHNRYAFEISRGCSFGCRFCEAGYIYRPLRHRSKKSIIEGIIGASENLGYDEVSMLSLNSGEYPQISTLLGQLKDYAEVNNIEISLPSLRVSSITEELLKSFDKKKKLSFTIAPEAGSERLRRVINKRISDDEIFKSVEMLFSAGYASIKLYFIIGLPTETMGDVESIATLSNKIVEMGKKKGVRRLNITVSTSSFVPKPFTPFQWEEVPKREEILRKQDFLKKRLMPPINYKWHDIEASLLEAAFSRGDKRLGRVLYEAFLSGCKLDSWSEQFRFDLWLEAFKRAGLDFYEYIEEKFDISDPLPWDFIDIGVSKNFLKEEREKALKEESTETCGNGTCFNCGRLKSLCSQIKVPDIDFVFPESFIKREETTYQYRAVLSKNYPATLIGHLDFVKNLTRSFRRSGVQLVYSKGFHPFPKIEISSPLPLGVSGENELMDFCTTSEISEEVFEKLNKTLVKGIVIKEIKKKDGRDEPLNKFTFHNYVIEIENLSMDTKNRAIRILEDFMSKKEYLIEIQKGGEIRKVDLRKKVVDCSYDNKAIFLKMANGGITKISEILFDSGSQVMAKIIRKSMEIPHN